MEMDFIKTGFRFNVGLSRWFLGDFVSEILHESKNQELSISSKRTIEEVAWRIIEESGDRKLWI